MTEMDNTYRCGLVAIVGRPNVGKSTLLNHLLGQKLAITSPKPQTTRHRILGIKTRRDAQILYVDTPGLHQAGAEAMNTYLNRTAHRALYDVDTIVMVVEALRWTDEDQLVLDAIVKAKLPLIAAVNKVDKVKDKSQLLPYLAMLGDKQAFVDIIPVSALKSQQLERFESQVIQHLPVQAPLYPEDQLTDRSMRFIAAEIIREKIIRQLHDELPYATTVEIERFEEGVKPVRIAAVIWVATPNQKAIVIGKGGHQLKHIGSAAREDIQAAMQSKVHLDLWVRVKRGWADDEKALASLGYSDDTP
jgi:GTP-binding protein Era